MTDPLDGPADWPNIKSFIDHHANNIWRLIDNSAIGSATLDIGVPIYEGSMAWTVSVPHEVSEIAGRNRIQIDITLYATASDEERI